MNAINYWRQNKKWNLCLGKIGTVFSCTKIYASGSEQNNIIPYFFCIVDFADGGRFELMACANEEINIGDHVQCVLRKIGTGDKKNIIAYGPKIKKYENSQGIFPRQSNPER
ncbi:MAG: hypothetical protein A2821_03315 [Candidatus Magasanikbacteria bacterium RIFCSPHIGHO2_01_FULL_41_23]|uniref:DUF35 domain-containing protein n=1 Tax=Candidatus Magasanikbacteria bacterium RIFCSPLOWO2_01_FULL_40_15 TaxID=1798686 RepID=A0A1F6N237_9BACT|nr:MAG: hypothetical protein A2821_03315 [Candidatus Magasanikbacteria bacterium RIFCSPHIGHO2_01_FULL_41_23]OGH76481.1 MAG: hypothetical protein A3F22_03305 [Candidatus Magasanikbacteria bacterium RIFCSPHIGHO2_12_FULL_41_16]OGH77967.1 MAG: hypothetical protein A2983_01340 [Candidatus Magasanikbacteria bacterium RIFCSPLOWO2_01_FULL_40_15]